jgi:hypothetical protein
MTHNPDWQNYCAHGVDIAQPCQDCMRMRLYAQGATVTEVVEDEFGFAYRMESDDVRIGTPHSIPTFDRDRYPTDETLDRIERWPVQNVDDVRKCLDFVIDSWDNHYGGVSRTLSATEMSMVHAQKGEKFIRFATGGWSGNEALIAALQRNTKVHTFSCVATVRGGLHIYQY